MASVAELVNGLRQVFRSGRTKPIEWRQKQLTAMLQMLDDNMEAWNDALKKDLNKHKMESIVFELNLVRNDTVLTMNNLQEWMQPEKVKKEVLNMMDSCYIKYEPYGVALIIGAWNYPVQLTLLPMVGALAAGNCVLLKPSELAENVANLLADLIPKYFDKECVKVVNGGVQETTELLRQRFDYIFYTGNSMVGKIVMEAASKYLTPVTLELGGKSPVYVDGSADMLVTARRLMWGKCANAGQTCIAPDYVMCSPDVQPRLIQSIEQIMKEFYPEGVENSDSYGRIINQRHFERIQGLLKGDNKVAVGGNAKPEEKFVEPTILSDVKPDDTVMQSEIFGPVLPIMPVKDENEAIAYINDHEKPLALYIFAKDKKVTSKIIESTTSGGVTVNDVMMHAGLSSLPFGGVGNSGMGGYHGKFTFTTFSHRRACMERDLAMDSLQAIRYPPYNEKKLGWVKWLTAKKPARKGFFALFPFFILGTIFAFVIQSMTMLGM